MTAIGYIKLLQDQIDKYPEIGEFPIGYDNDNVFKSANIPIVVKVDRDLKIIDEVSCIDVWGELPEYKNVVIL